MQIFNKKKLSNLQFLFERDVSCSMHFNLPVDGAWLLVVATLAEQRMKILLCYCFCFDECVSGHFYMTAEHDFYIY